MFYSRNQPLGSVERSCRSWSQCESEVISATIVEETKWRRRCHNHHATEQSKRPMRAKQTCHIGESPKLHNQLSVGILTNPKIAFDVHRHNHSAYGFSVRNTPVGGRAVGPGEGAGVSPDRRRTWYKGSSNCCKRRMRGDAAVGKNEANDEPIYNLHIQ